MKKLFTAMLLFLSIQIVSAQSVEWAKQMTETATPVYDDAGLSVYVDASTSGNVYTTGRMEGANIDFGGGVPLLSSNGLKDIYIQKSNNAGTTLWAFNIGSSLNDQGMSITGNGGQIFVTGFFNGTVDFDPSAGVTNLISAGGKDIFIACYDVTGALPSLQWAHRMGGTGSDEGHGIVVQANHVYATGYYSGTASFPTVTLTSNGLEDIFVTKMVVTGVPTFDKSMGGPLADEGHAITLDPTSGEIYTTGYINPGADLNPGLPINTIPAGWVSGGAQKDIFISKLNNSGGFVWGRAMGGPTDDEGKGIKIYGTDVYTTGYFTGTADFNPTAGISTLTSNGMEDIFVSRLNSGGARLTQAKMGGTQTDIGYGIDIDANGVYTTGTFKQNADFDPGTSASQVYYPTYAGATDIFVSTLGLPTTTFPFISAKSYGSGGLDGGASIKVDGTGALYVTGGFSNSVYFGPGIGAITHTSGGLIDIFNMKLMPCASVAVTASPVTGCSCSALSLSGTPSGGSFYIGTTLVASPYLYAGTTSSSYTYVYIDTSTGCSYTSAPASITITPLVAPTYTVNPTSPTTANIVISPVSCAYKYSIWFRETGTTVWSTNTTLPYISTHSLVGLTATTAGTNYEIAIRSIDSCGNASAFGPINNFTLFPGTTCILGSPTILTASAGSITWSTVVGAGAYQVWTKVSGTWTLQGCTAATFIVPSGLTPGSVYDVQVRAKCLASCTTTATSPWGPFGTLLAFTARPSMEDMARESNINIFPNPTSGILNIELNANQSQQTLVKVVDITGRMMSQTQAKTEVGLNNLSIDMQQLAIGMYLVEIYADNKLIKVEKIEKN